MQRYVECGGEGWYAPVLSRFVVFNSKFGPDDKTEGEKLLFFHPNDMPKDDQLKCVGLAEGLIDFSRCVCIPVFFLVHICVWKYVCCDGLYVCR